MREISPRALQCPFCGCPAEFFNAGIEVKGKESSDNTEEVNPSESILLNSEPDEENNKGYVEPDDNTKVLRQRLTNVVKEYAKKHNNQEEVVEEAGKQNAFAVGSI